MKLKEWADKQGISYLTAWRWFKAEDPRLSKAYQSDSGTIIIPDENEPLEQIMAGNTHTDAISLFLKKTVEFSKSNSTVEDFAAYVISNFTLKLNSTIDTPKYSRQKPKSEEIQKHFQKFLPDKEKEEHLKAVKTLLKEQGKDAIFDQDSQQYISEYANSFSEPSSFTKARSGINDCFDIDDFESLTNNTNTTECVIKDTTESLVTQIVDLNNIPQQINYIDSTSQALSGFSLSNNSILTDDNSTISFQPTQKEFQSAVKVIETVENKSPVRKRGRKSFKKVQQ